jgi:hypothetical protein
MSKPTFDPAPFEGWTNEEKTSHADGRLVTPRSMTYGDIESMKTVIEEAKTQPGVPIPFGSPGWGNGPTRFIYYKADRTLWSLEVNLKLMELVRAVKLSG